MSAPQAKVKMKEIFLGALALSTLLLTDPIFYLCRLSLQPQEKGTRRPQLKSCGDYTIEVDRI